MQSQSLFKTITRNHFNKLKWSIFCLSALPFLYLCWKYYTDDLGINPLAYLTRETGEWAVIFLIITLIVTPFRRFSNDMLTKYQMAYGKRLSDWNFIIRLRRMFGLYSAFYVTLHLLVYLWFDQNFEFDYILIDIRERPFILAGMAGFIIYVLLTITSNSFMIKTLKKNWLRLHKLMYPLAILTMLHIWWQGKEGIYNMLEYSVIITFLLLYRVLISVGIIHVRKGDTGMMVDERKERLEREKRLKLLAENEKNA